jgi:hypothetical protein
MSTRTANRDQLTETAADAAIEQACRILRLPTIRGRFDAIAATAARQQASYKALLVELLAAGPRQPWSCGENRPRRHDLT